MLPVCIYVIPYVDEKKWRTNSTDVHFEDENSFFGGAGAYAGMNRDTVLFNKSYLHKSLSVHTINRTEKPSFMAGESIKKPLVL